MQTKLHSHLKIYIPGYNLYPLSLVVKWLRSYYNRVVYTNEARKEAVPDKKAFRKKVAAPLIKVFPKFLNPEFVSRSSLSSKEIIIKHRYNLESSLANKKYQKYSELAYQTRDGIPAKNIKDKLPLNAVNYAETMSFGPWVLAGPLNPNPDTIPIEPYQGKSVLSIIIAYLSGDVLIQEELRGRDELVEDHAALITLPSRLAGFQVKMRTRLRRALCHIQDANYAAETVKYENDRTNQLVSQYAREEFMPFQSRGNSHLDFIVIPETAELQKSPKLTETRNRIHRYFLGENLKPLESVILPEGAKPSDFIGNPEQPLLVDMYVEIKVATK